MGALRKAVAFPGYVVGVIGTQTGGVIPSVYIYYLPTSTALETRESRDVVALA